MDLHIHTPASADYQQRESSYIQLLQRAEECGIDILAFTDHNSVRGYAQMWREIEDLELLEALKRIEPQEARLLNEYRRLLNRILLLPGFEFTATFGFHILAIFPEDTSIRTLEHLLLALHIPDEKLNQGTSEVGATTDVLHAFELLHEAGALVIGAHVNSTHGIAMQGFPFGGQTKIAYTQSPYLHALEATDLENSGPRTTARFFNGSKPEYPRRMICLQGSDAHRLVRDPDRPKDLGIGDRMTEIQLDQVSFDALKSVFENNQFGRVRPYQATASRLALVLAAREEGETESQLFHERLNKSRRRTNTIFKDIVALANGDGGAISIGLSATPKGEIVGVPHAKTTITQLEEDIARFCTPEPPVTIESLSAQDRELIVVTITSGTDKPYALTSGEIYVRDGASTVIASRDQIVALVTSSLPVTPPPTHVVTDDEQPDAVESAVTVQVDGTTPPEFPIPHTGVEIVASADKDGKVHHTMRDLRNRKIVENVTNDSARRLWSYAIKQREAGEPVAEKIRWDGPYGIVRVQKQRTGGHRYDLAYQQNGTLRVFYGVTDADLADEWKTVIDRLTDKAATK